MAQGWQTITAQIVSIVAGVTGVQEVSNFEKSSFRGFPAVTITPSDNTSDYQSTTEKERTYAFNVRIYIEMFSNQQGGTGDGLKETDRIMRDVVDNITNAFDKSANARLGGTVLMVVPTPSRWQYDVGRNMRMAEISLSCKTLVDSALL